ncbi:terminase large subunit [Ancylobacter defluvii]|uniref:Terminase n=1 Tax=Ancylobacter defluvii TaxID=1282440 RepID=A0A9W6K2R6_9HYPH|nr:terminase large subunit [Ancylobacter defluvii]MBS7588279.1 terminase large subunit [Ancylobacter defluvii]GLK86675.1 terminase [Ancylobacter defluvii]
MWDLSCPDWQDRIREGRSLVPDLPLFHEEANLAVQFFDNLRIPDVEGMPLMRDACGEWFREIVAVLFGSYDPVAKQRYIQEIFALIAKKNSKTTYGAGLMLTALLMNTRPRAEFLFVGPTQAIADLAFSQAAGMIEADPELLRRFHIREHLKEIKDRLNGAKLKIKTFDLKILTGPRPAGVMIDELHLLGGDQYAPKVLRQLRGGRQSTPEGFLIITTTQSDSPPTGAFEEELKTARAIRDGKVRGKMLPILYEFPDDIAGNPKLWRDTRNWPMVMPNLGRSLRLDDLADDWETEQSKGEHAIRVWASQHLNIQIGLGLRGDSWAGAEFWEAAADASITLDEVLRRSEVVVIGIDGGGLDDLLGLCVLGRCATTKKWLCWFHAWAHEIALDRRKSEAGRLRTFEKQGDLTMVKRPGDDVDEVVVIIRRVEETGLLAEESAVAVDSVGIGDIVDAVTTEDIISIDRIEGISQGWKLNGAIKTTERKIAGGDLLHAGRPLMAFCVSNAKIVPKGNAVSIDKAVSGTAKIDPLMALFNAVYVMASNPEPAFSQLPDDFEIRVI